MHGLSLIVKLGGGVDHFFIFNQLFIELNKYLFGRLRRETPSKHLAHTEKDIGWLLGENIVSNLKIGYCICYYGLLHHLN